MIGIDHLINDGKKELVIVAKNKEKIRISFASVELVTIYFEMNFITIQNYSSGLLKNT
jgi:hypothetical protein